MESKGHQVNNLTSNELFSKTKDIITFSLTLYKIHSQYKNKASYHLLSLVAKPIKNWGSKILTKVFKPIIYLT